MTETFREAFLDHVERALPIGAKEFEKMTAILLPYCTKREIEVPKNCQVLKSDDIYSGMGAK
jgi:hypothetical protein